MGQLIYATNVSLDGYIEDVDGHFDWKDPDAEEFRFITNLERAAGVYLYGRRLYEAMMVWETNPSLAGASPLMRDFAEMWQAAEKIVYSRTLESVSTRKTQVERNFNPEAVRRIKESVNQDILIGGSELAAHAFRAGLIDACHLFLVPIIVGGGKQAFPDHVPMEFKLLKERRFDNGVVFLHYQTKQGRAA